MTSSIVIVILVTSFATYLSRFLGVVSSEKIKETSKWFRWFNCLAYSTLAALITRTIIIIFTQHFPLQLYVSKSNEEEGGGGGGGGVSKRRSDDEDYNLRYL